MILDNELTTIRIFYYIPKRLIIQEFLWQYTDLAPELRRTHKFLWFWKNNIIATIKEIELAHVALTGNKFVNAREYIKI